MSLTRQIHDQLIAGGLMQRSPAPTRRYGESGGPSPPPVEINPPADASEVLRVRCIGGSGDVLLVCAVAGALKAQRPGRYIILETDANRAEIAYRNPSIDVVVPTNQRLTPRERVVDLRPEADWEPRKHRLRQFAHLAGVSLESLRFFIHRNPYPLPVASYIALHPGPTEFPHWIGRNWLPERWTEVARQLAAQGETVVVVGSIRDSAFGIQGTGAEPKSRSGAATLNPECRMPSAVLDLRGQTTVHQMAHVVAGARLFVGIESLPAIIAQAFGVPAVLFFGSILPELRLFRDNVISVTAPALRCLGCHHYSPLPAITTHCPVGGQPCQSRVTVGIMLDAIRRAEPLTHAPRATKVVLPVPTIKQPPPIKLTPHSTFRIPHSPVVLLRRENSDGDVLVASGVAAAVKKRFPTSRVVFETACPALLKGHPYIDEIVAPGWQGPRDMLADMNVSCEQLPYTNMLAVYASRAAVAPEDCEFFLHTEPIHGLPDEYAVMHMGPPGAGKRRWVGRAWLEERFLAVADHLAEQKLPTVLVGGARSEGRGTRDEFSSLAPNPALLAPPFDFRGRTTLYQLAYVIAQTKLFVGIDSLPFHIAQAFNVPGVAFFGSIRPELRIYRENMKGVSASELSCIGCHHDRRTVFPEPPETSICRIGHEHCRTAVTVRRFLKALEDVLSTAIRNDRIQDSAFRIQGAGAEPQSQPSTRTLDAEC